MGWGRKIHTLQKHATLGPSLEETASDLANLNTKRLEKAKALQVLCDLSLRISLVPSNEP
jgi:hypothetical protein